MKILALIPARGGSKRLPGKNIRSLGGKPLILWSVDVACEIPEICDVLISTDAPEIAEAVSGTSALVPWLRPPELSTDTAGSVDVALHALDWYESAKLRPDALMLLQPTSPFRNKESIVKGIELFRQNKNKPVIGVSPVKSHPHWCFQIQSGILVPFTPDQQFNTRGQDLAAAYAINGSLYLIAPEDLRRERSFLTGSTIALLSEHPEESIDIDTEWDWKMAEAYLTTR